MAHQYSLSASMGVLAQDCNFSLNSASQLGLSLSDLHESAMNMIILLTGPCNLETQQHERETLIVALAANLQTLGDMLVSI